MVLIGMLRRYKNPMVKDAVAAMFAKEHRAEVIFFTSDQIDFDKKLIYGRKYKYGSWVEEVSYFPDVVYNDIPLRKDAPTYNRLEQEGIPFTTHRLGKSKMEFQDAMATNSYLTKYMIETIPYNGAETLRQMLDNYKTVFLKPNRGHKGLGITVFENVNNGIHVSDAVDLDKVILDSDLESYLSSIKDIEYHHLQPGINSVTPQGNPFVIRSYVGRNGRGNWRLFFHYAAISSSKSKIVNVSVGSSMSYITAFLESMHGEKKAKTIKTNLNTVAIEIAKQTQTLVTPMIDALGLDLGINKNGDIYIIEVNAFPATRPFEAVVERQAIPYTLFLANNYKKRNVNNITGG